MTDPIAALRRLPISWVLIDASRNVFAMSETFETDFGVVDSSFRGPITDLIPLSDGLQTALDATQQGDTAETVVDKKGSKYCLHCAPWSDEDQGHNSGVLISVQAQIDTPIAPALDPWTLWQQATISLEHSDTDSDIGAWRWDLPTNDISFSTDVFKRLGQPIREAVDLGDQLRALYHPDDLKSLTRTVCQSVESGKAFSIHVRMMAASGRYRSFLIRGLPIAGPMGKIQQVVGFETDLTELMDLNTKLLRAEQIATVGNWSRRIGEDRMYWSPELCRIYGLDPETYEPSMQRLDDTFHEDDVELVEKGEIRILQKWRLDPNMVDRIRVRVKRPGGEIRYCTISSVVVVDAQGNPFELAGTVQDITELVEAEHRLRTAQKSEVVAQLVGGTAHDFNNYLAVILGNLELLEDEEIDDSLTELVSDAISAAEKGAELTRNLLSVARQAVLNPQRMVPSDSIRGMSDMLERLLPENIQLQSKLAEDGWGIHADHSSFENAILNLVINARDAMQAIGPHAERKPNGGQLSIKVANTIIMTPDLDPVQGDLDPGPYVTVSVQDTGTGIDDQTLDKVFTPFFSTKPMEHGSGLGLSMVQGFARQSGGTLRLSTQVGVGTTVSLFFPASALDASFEIEEKITATNYRHDGHVLLAEDNVQVRRVLGKRLEEMGLTCTSVPSGDHALAVFEDLGQVDLLLTDIVMPGSVQGPELASRLRRIAPDLKVIFITGYPDEVALQQGATDDQHLKLMKPVSRQDLSQALATVLGPSMDQT